MSRSPQLSLAASLFLAGLAVHESATAEDQPAAGWAPAKGALVTRWAKDVSPGNAHPEYPRPQMVRDEWMNLNGLWQLEFGKEDDAVPAGTDLPMRILVPFPVESILSGVAKRADRLWYRRNFQVPENWQGRRILLHFQAVDWESAVYVNGKLQGGHRGGYDAFSFDITDALKPSGDQEVIVRVFDPTSDGKQPRGKQANRAKGIWYTPTTGIWQTTWLEPVPEAGIGSLLMTPDLDGSFLKLTVEGGDAAGCTIQAVAHDGKAEVARATGGVGSEIRLEIPKDRLKTWSPDAPFLYDLTVTLKRGDRVVDQVQSYFGMRKIDLGKDGEGRVRIRLNNEVLFQVGPLDQGYWPDGLYTAPTDEALRYDIEVTKRLGFNMTRKHVKIEPARWYYWCDKLGLLVWQDMPSGDNWTTPKSEKLLAPEEKAQFEVELRRMVEGRRNHPSIVMWILFNEGWGQHDTPRYVEMVRKLDPSRLIDNASGWEDAKVGDVFDIHMYRHPMPPAPQPDRAGVLGECGAFRFGDASNADFVKGTGLYTELLGKFHRYHNEQGMSGVVYTQLVDVEGERNGLMTYDRSVIQVNVEKVADANRGR
ncbi:MAG: glycoside hydrolase family 2 [Verrucomicrobia bacterium]|nr:glycoside hydrolase family 2 [Verrucomicrobiota bacterium]